jgi:hypothetical protein
MMRKNIYRWHRRLSLIIALPLVLSAGSGILHPIMTNIRPSVATQGLRPAPIDGNKIVLPLEAALAAAGIDSFYKVRIIHIDTNWFYQVQKSAGDIPQYLSTVTGKVLPGGDWLYAQYLARQFLEGPEPGGSSRNAAGPLGMAPSTAGASIPAAGVAMSAPMVAGMPDCCGAATSSVLNARGSKVTDEIRLTHFDGEYNDINRIIPVYKVSFDRGDGIRIYVETMQDRFAFAVDNKRAAFNRVFELIHTYSWLDFLGEGRLVVEFLLVFTAFITTLLGVYIFFASRSKKVSGNGYVKARRNHRYSAIVVSLFTAMFTFSGGYHALYKLRPVDHYQSLSGGRFATKDVRFDLSRLSAIVRKPITGVSLVNLDNSDYWQVTTMKGTDPAGGDRGPTKGNHGPAKGYHKDLMKDMQATMPPVCYVRAGDGVILPDGDARYAAWLAGRFSGFSPRDIMSTQPITKFDGDYNFTDKILPVWKVDYRAGGHVRYFVETSTGKLSARVDDLDVLEGYSFALLHKHEFLGWAGKSVKDFSTMFWAAAQIALVAVGLILYFKWRERRKKRSPSPND